MVGEGEEADACTSDFGAYWEDNAALAGGVLVYNTGRSLGQFQGLLEYKAGALPVPDVLITAVGTKIWRLDAEGGTRGTATGLAWQEDHQWARTLDEGWDLVGIKRATQKVVDEHSDAAFWLVSMPVGGVWWVGGWVGGLERASGGSSWMGNSCLLGIVLRRACCPRALAS